MFLRTERLFLRPVWLEDVPELTRAIGHEAVARTVACAPWPYGEEHAREWVQRVRHLTLPSLLITLPGEGGCIVGGCGLDEGDSGPEAGCWIAPEFRGRGYATEALTGLLALARMSGHRRLTARHAADNPAAGRVLRKAGFCPTGCKGALRGIGPANRIEAQEYALDLAEADGPCDAPMPKAA